MKKTDQENMEEYLGRVSIIKRYAFYGTDIRTVKIPDNIHTMESFCFSNSQLETVEIGAGISAISVEAFAACENLRKVVIPGNVKTILCRAFENCTALEEVVISEGVEMIDDDAFRNCAIKKITLPSTLKLLGDHAFQNCPLQQKTLAVPKGCDVGICDGLVVHSVHPSEMKSVNMQINKQKRLIAEMITDYKSRLRFIEDHTNGDDEVTRKYQEYVACLEELSLN